MATLKGLALAYDKIQKPLTALTYMYKEVYKSDIIWDFKTPEAIGKIDFDTTAKRYDVLVVNPSQISEAHERGSLVDLKTVYPEAQLQQIRSENLDENYDLFSMGYSSYAFPMDLTTRVSAYKAGEHLIESAIPTTFEEVLKLSQDLSDKGKSIAIPFMPEDAFLTFYTICVQLYVQAGCPATEDSNAASPLGGAKIYSASRQKKELIRTISNKLWHDDIILSYEIGAFACEILTNLMKFCHKNSYLMNSIDILNHMSTEKDIVYCPMLESFIKYTGTSPAKPLIKFADIPLTSKTSKIGKTIIANKNVSVLNSYGVAISETSPYIEEASNFLSFFGNTTCMRTTFFEAGGQSPSLFVWNDPNSNVKANNFFSSTINTHLSSLSKPQFKRVSEFEKEAGDKIRRYILTNSSSPNVLIDELNYLYKSKSS